MKVILSNDIRRLGKKYDIRDVSDGYARNFLLPRGLAIPATADALKSLDEKRSREEHKSARDEADYRAQAEHIAGLTLRFKMKLGEKGKTFGSVSERDIADALRREKISVEKEWIALDEHIKTTGEHTVSLNFPHGIKGEIKVVVEAE